MGSSNVLPMCFTTIGITMKSYIMFFGKEIIYCSILVVIMIILIILMK